MRLTTLLLLSLLTFLSCGKDDDPEPEPEPKVGNCLTAVIDGVDFAATTTQGIYFVTTIDYGDLGVVESKSLTIIGTIASLTSVRTINLIFACGEFTDELDMNEVDEECGVSLDYNTTDFSNPAGATVAIAEQGIINIESYTADRIRGTFSFSGADQNGVQINVTDGFFDTTIAQ